MKKLIFLSYLSVLLGHAYNVHGAFSSLQDQLIRAIGDNNIDKVRSLLDMNADPNIADDLGYTPLHRAVETNNLDLVRALLDSDADANAITVFNETPITLAAAQENWEIVRILLEVSDFPFSNTNAIERLTPFQRSIAEHLQNAKHKRVLKQVFEEEFQKQPGATPYLQSIVYDIAGTPESKRPVLNYKYQ